MDLVTGTLILLGAGFLVANARLAVEYLRFLKRRRRALLTWQTPRPPYYALTIALGIATGLLVIVKLLRHPSAGVRRDDDVPVLWPTWFR